MHCREARKSTSSRAQFSELAALADMANRLVPGVQITEPDLERYFTFDPESILTFSRKAKSARRQWRFSISTTAGMMRCCSTRST